MKKKLLATILVFTLSLSSFSGYVNAEEISEENEIIERLVESSELTDEQRNSLAMLNHLVVLSDTINSSQNNRLYLEEVYDSIISNTYPNAVDDETNSYLRSLRNTIDKYRLITVKRERIQFIREQEQAQAIRSAIPNPIGLLSAVKSKNKLQLIASVLYMAVDSVDSYTGAMSDANKNFLESEWELDDDARTALQSNRSNSWDYLRSIVNDYKIPGDLTLSEDAIKKFVDKRDDKNLALRIQYFEDHENTYKGYAGYWALLAESYYELAQKDSSYYSKCLTAINKYEETQAHIFRKDHDLAKLLPMGIVCADNLYKEDKFIVIADDYVNKIKNNLEDEDWDIRYFVATTDIDLCRRSGDKKYLEDAYELIRTSVTTLVKEQINMNETYLADVKIVDYDKKKDTKQRIKEAKEYNNLIKEERKTELAPVYEPLRINCELLFDLAEELDIPDSQRNWINNILHDGDSPLFLVAAIDKDYWFNTTASATSFPDMSCEFDGKTIKLPTGYLTTTSVIEVNIDGANGKKTISDWEIDEVERNKSHNIADFVTVYTNQEIKKYKFSNGDKISIKLTPMKDAGYDEYSFEYKTEVNKKLFNKVLDDVRFVLEK